MITILVVYDEAVLVELLRDVLTDAGYRVVTARNGHDALAVLADTVPAVIISDIMMPVMDGYTLLRRVRQAAIAAKVVLTSAAGLRQDIVPQPDAFVAKPYDIAQIEAIVARLIRA